MNEGPGISRIRFFRIKNAMLLHALASNFIGVLVIMMLAGLDTSMAVHSTSIFYRNPDLGFLVFAFVAPLVITLIYERPIRRFLNIAYQSGTLVSAPPLTVQQRLLNEPFFQIKMALAIWVASALFHAGLFALLDAGPQIVRSAFFLGLHTGLITCCIEFFLLEFVLQRRLAPLFFPEGNMSTVAGTTRISIRKRLLAMICACNLIPFLSMLLSLTDITGGALSIHAAAEFRTAVVVLSVLFMTVGLWLVFLVSANLTRPLQEIIRVLGEVRRGNFDARVEVTSNDELGYTGDMINAMNEGLKERDFVKETFGKYVSSEIRDEILSGRLALEGELTEATVLFADLRNFTPMVARIPPRAVVDILNRYFSNMEGAIQAHHGLVLQYIGDEIEAVFGAPLHQPDHPLLAVRAALEMRDKLALLNRELEGLGYPQLAHGIGIHTGEVLAASIGSPSRLSYALVGDTVNLAARLQELNKIHGTDIIISEATRNRLRDDFSCNRLPRTTVRGWSGEISAYDLN